jgi:hypothetical protein
VTTTRAAGGEWPIPCHNGDPRNGQILWIAGLA